MLGQYPLPRAMHEDLTNAMHLVTTKYAEWRTRFPQYDGMEWNSLPEGVRTRQGRPGGRSCPGLRHGGLPGVGPRALHPHAALPVHRVPEPPLRGGHLRRHHRGGVPVHRRHRHHRALRSETASPAGAAPGVNRFRRSQRQVQSTRGSTAQVHNTVRSFSQSAAGSSHHIKQQTGGEEANEPETNVRGDGGTTVGGSSHNIGTHLRMHLDTGLVRNIARRSAAGRGGAAPIREVTRCDPYGNFFIGYCLVNQNNPGPQLVDNAVVTSMMVTRALQSVVHQWYRRFAVPLPYHSGVDGPMLRQTINGLGIGDLGTGDGGAPDSIRQLRGTRYIAMDVPHTQVYPAEDRTATVVYHFDGLWCEGSTMIPAPDRSATIAPVDAEGSTGGPSPSPPT